MKTKWCSDFSLGVSWSASFHSYCEKPFEFELPLDKVNPCKPSHTKDVTAVLSTYKLSLEVRLPFFFKCLKKNKLLNIAG